MLDAVTRQSLLDAIPSPAAILDGEARIIAVNRAWVRFAQENGGDTEGCYLGRSYLSTCLGERGGSSEEAAMVAEGLRAVLHGRQSFRCEYPCHSPDELRWFEAVIAPVETVEGRLVLVMHHDISRRRRVQADVVRSQDDSAALAALVASSSDAIISYDLDGLIRTWNHAAERLYGYRPDEVIGRSMEVLYPPDWPHRITHYRDRIIAEGNVQVEVVRKTKAGELRDIAVSAAPVHSPEGDVVAILNIHRDVTEERAAREHLNFVTRELSHRAKNLLAVVLSIERQTARGAGSLDDFRQRFAARLRSLAASIELLGSQSWGHVDMDSLARSQLAIFTEPEQDQVAFGGPPVMLHADAVEALGMSLHELGTNALKHGALGPAGGAIRLSWRLAAAGDGPGEDAAALVVAWDETSPAIAGPPAHTGFGHMVVTRLTEQKLRAAVSLDVCPGRLTWTATIPSRHFTPGE